jgi:hypothetical protein
MEVVGVLVQASALKLEATLHERGLGGSGVIEVALAEGAGEGERYFVIISSESSTVSGPQLGLVDIHEHMKGRKHRCGQAQVLFMRSEWSGQVQVSQRIGTQEIEIEFKSS